MIKKYFIAMDYWESCTFRGAKYNRFLATIVETDIGEISIQDVARDCVKTSDKNGDVDIDKVVIKLTAFNPV